MPGPLVPQSPWEILVPSPQSHREGHYSAETLPNTPMCLGFFIHLDYFLVFLSPVIHILGGFNYCILLTSSSSSVLLEVWHEVPDQYLLKRDFLGGQWLTPSSQFRSPSLIPGQGTRSHMPQLKILNAATKTKKITPATEIEDPMCHN